MNQAHYHLVFNHLPIIIPFVGIFVMLAGMGFKSELLKRTAYSIFILGVLFLIPAFATGAGAGDVVKNIPGVDDQFIHAHGEAAETFTMLSLVFGGIALLGLWVNWKQKSISNLLSYLTIVFCAIVLFFAKQTATTGGEIRHTEIREAVK